MPTTTTGKASEFITFSRTSNATVTDSNGVIKWAAHNLLLASEQFDASNWQKDQSGSTLPAVTANNAAAPNSTTTADKVDFGAIDAAGDYSFVYQAFTALDATYTFGIWVKAFSAGDVGKKLWLKMWNTAAVGQIAVTLTADWQYVSTSGALTAGGSRRVDIATIGSTQGGENQGAVSVLLWGAHLYRSDLGGMQANTSAYPMYNPTTPKNLLGFTENFENAAWSKSNTSAPGTTIVAPNGLQNADLLVSTSGTTGGSTYQSGGPTWSSNSMVLFNLATGAVGTVTAGSFTSTSITPVGTDGWYRCSAVKDGYTLSFYGKAGGWSSVALQTFSSEKMRLYPSTSSTAQTGTGDGTSGIYLWGAQLSDSASLDPYVANHFAAPSAAAYYGPRRDFDPVTLACKGLLVEEQRTNTILRSAEFDNAAWTKAGSSITANVVVAPDGVSTADKIVENNANSTHYVSEGSLASTSTVSQTFSVYAKAGERTQIALEMLGVPAGGFAYFNLSDGTVISSGGGLTSRSITPVGNGWYRCIITAVANASSVTGIIYITSGGTVSYAGDGTSGVFVWGAQMEQGSFATSYIPVGATTAGATRLADEAKVSTAAFPYSATEGSVVVAFNTAGGIASGARPISLSAGDSARVIDANFVGTNNVSVYNGTTQISVGAVAANTSYKLAAAYKTASYAIVLNGGSAVTNSDTLVNVANQLYIGNYSDGLKQLNGHIRQITYIPRRLSNAELQARTV